MKKRKFKRIVKNGLLYLTLVMAMILFILASIQISISNPVGTLVLVLSGGYIITFCAVNEVE